MNDRPAYVTGTLEGYIVVPLDLFEKLLNGLARQKSINEINPDVVAADIDHLWVQGMALLQEYRTPKELVHAPSILSWTRDNTV